VFTIQSFISQAWDHNFAIMDLANITGAIRVDARTNVGSVLNVIKTVHKSTPSYASTTFNRLVNSPGTELGTGCPSLKINGKGRATPCADVRTLIEIIWALPGGTARDFRRASAQTVCRVLGSDLSLVEEIKNRHETLQQSSGDQAAQQFLVGAISTDVIQHDAKRFKIKNCPWSYRWPMPGRRVLMIDLWLQEKQQQLEERRLCEQK
jgi:hypothetical protein